MQSGGQLGGTGWDRLVDEVWKQPAGALRACYDVRDAVYAADRVVRGPDPGEVPLPCTQRSAGVRKQAGCILQPPGYLRGVTACHHLVGHVLSEQPEGHLVLGVSHALQQRLVQDLLWRQAAQLALEGITARVEARVTGSFDDLQGVGRSVLGAEGGAEGLIQTSRLRQLLEV